MTEKEKKLEYLKEEFKKLDNDMFATMVYDLDEILALSYEVYLEKDLNGKQILNEMSDFLTDVVLNNLEFCQYVIYNQESIIETHQEWGTFLVDICQFTLVASMLGGV